MANGKIQRGPARAQLIYTTEEEIEVLRHWVERWARWMGNNSAAAMKECGHKAKSMEGQRAISNYSVAEDDSDAFWEVRSAKQLLDLDAAVDSLRLKQPWTYWAFCVEHGLTYASCWKYPNMDPKEGFENALEELRLVVKARNLAL